MCRDCQVTVVTLGGRYEQLSKSNPSAQPYAKRLPFAPRGALDRLNLGMDADRSQAFVINFQRSNYPAINSALSLSRQSAVNFAVMQNRRHPRM